MLLTPLIICASPLAVDFVPFDNRLKMNGDLTAVHDWSKLTQQDEEIMGNNWRKETNLSTLQKSGQSIQNRACYEFCRRPKMQESNLSLIKELDFLRIQLKLYHKVKKVQTSNYDDTIETITS